MKTSSVTAEDIGAQTPPDSHTLSLVLSLPVRNTAALCGGPTPPRQPHSCCWSQRRPGSGSRLGTMPTQAKAALSL